MNKWWKILKAPPPWTQGTPHTPSRQWHWVQIENIPGLLKQMDPETFHLAHEIWRDTTIKVYPIPHKNLWYPSIRKRTNAQMWYTGYNVKDQALTDDWEPAQFARAGTSQKPLEELVASGTESFELDDDTIGLNIIIEKGPNAKFIMEGNVTPTSNFWKYVKKHEAHGSVIEDYDLTNGAAAGLGIVAHHAVGKSKGMYKTRQQYFLDFGIGPLSRDTDSKYIKELVDKGLMRREEYHRTPNMSNYPVVTPKGLEVGNVFDIPPKIFFGEFKKEVLRAPDEDFTSYYDDPAKFSAAGFGA